MKRLFHGGIEEHGRSWFQYPIGEEPIVVECSKFHGAYQIGNKIRMKSNHTIPRTRILAKKDLIRLKGHLSLTKYSTSKSTH